MASILRILVELVRSYNFHNLCAADLRCTTYLHHYEHDHVVIDHEHVVIDHDHVVVDHVFHVVIDHDHLVIDHDHVHVQHRLLLPASDGDGVHLLESLPGSESIQVRYRMVQMAWYSKI